MLWGNLEFFYRGKAKLCKCIEANLLFKDWSFLGVGSWIRSTGYSNNFKEFWIFEKNLGQITWLSFCFSERDSRLGTFCLDIFVVLEIFIMWDKLIIFCYIIMEEHIVKYCIKKKKDFNNGFKKE